MEIAAFREGSLSIIKMLVLSQINVEIIVAPADSKIYMEKKSKGPKSPRHLWRIWEAVYSSSRKVFL